MERNHLQTDNEPKDKVLHFLSLKPMRPKEQITINNELGIRICRAKSQLASIAIVCPNGTEIYLPQKENHLFKPISDETDYAFFPIQLERGKWAKIGNYNVRAAVGEKGITLNLETYGQIQVQLVDKKEDLRKVLSRLSSGDNQQPQLSKVLEPLHISDSSQE